jgi:rod shape determining protein RodA
MAAVFDRPSLRHRVSPWLQGFDGPLAFVVFLLACAGLLTMYSSGFDHGTRFVDHGRQHADRRRHHVRGGAGAAAAADELRRAAVPAGVALLVAVAVFGITKKGARAGSTWAS